MTLDDARVKFYLQHRDQLQEWFDLRPDVAAAMDDCCWRWMSEHWPRN
jgi:hypothetical protein